MAGIDIKGLTKFYAVDGGEGYLCALKDVNMRVREGEFVCLLGPSGCGKTTLLNILSGLDDRHEGAVLVGSEELRRQRGGRIRIGYVFQEARLLPWLTVEGNIRFALESERMDKERWKELVHTHLELVGLKDYGRYYPNQLSGGMQQRVAVARAFAVEPDLLLMDEPFNSLDEFTARRMRGEVLTLWSRFRKTVLFVTHNSLEATYLADRIILMTRGPGSIYREVVPDLPRPRSYDDPKLFEVNSAMVKDFLARLREADPMEIP